MSHNLWELNFGVTPIGAKLGSSWANRRFISVPRMPTPVTDAVMLQPNKKNNTTCFHYSKKFSTAFVSSMTLLLFFLAPVYGQTNYYVSENGSNANSGTDPSAPFRTIQRASNEMGAGDVCHIGDGYYCETLRPNPVLIGTHGTPGLIYQPWGDAQPKIVAGRKLDVNWTVHSGHIWKASIPASFYQGTGIQSTQRFVQMFIDDQAMVEARWPNIDIDAELVHMHRGTAKAGTTKTRLIDANLPPGDFSDAKVHIVPGAEWISWTSTISNYQPGQSFDFDFTDWPYNPNLDRFSYDPEQGDRYYLFGCLAALDKEGEWHLDTNTNTVYLWCPDNVDPNTKNIFVKTERYAVNLYQRENMLIKGLRLLGGGLNMNEAFSCVIEDCHMRYVNHARECDGYFTDILTGNYVGGSDNIIRRCRIHHAGRSGIFDDGDRNTITECIISDVNYDAAHTGAIRSRGRGSKYTWNTLYNSGRHLIFFMGAKSYFGQPFEIGHNNCGHGGFLSSDCGILYTWGTDHENGVIHHNYVHNNHAAHFPSGIYFDALGTTAPIKNCIVHHNYVANIGFTAFYLVSSANGIQLYHNTDDGNSQFSINHFEQPAFEPDWSGSVIVNNVFNSAQRTVQMHEANALQLAVSSNYVVNIPSLLDEDWFPVADSPVIDRGRTIPGINDDFAGDAPDAGCMETDLPRWFFGANALPDWD